MSKLSDLVGQPVIALGGGFTAPMATKNFSLTITGFTGEDNLDQMRAVFALRRILKLSLGFAKPLVYKQQYPYVAYIAPLNRHGYVESNNVWRGCEIGAELLKAGFNGHMTVDVRTIPFQPSPI